jgi:Flp pilus assembly protein TadB
MKNLMARLFISTIRFDVNNNAVSGNQDGRETWSEACRLHLIEMFATLDDSTRHARLDDGCSFSFSGLLRTREASLLLLLSFMLLIWMLLILLQQLLLLLLLLILQLLLPLLLLD